MYQRDPPAGESQSNGNIERTVGLVLKAALVHRVGVEVPSVARMLCWLVEFAAYLTSATSAATERRRYSDCMDERTTPILGFGREDVVHPQSCYRQFIAKCLLAR